MPRGSKCNVHMLVYMSMSKRRVPHKNSVAVGHARHRNQVLVLLLLLPLFCYFARMNKYGVIQQITITAAISFSMVAFIVF